MKKSILILLIAAAAIATGCSSSYRAARHPSILIELNSADYELSEPVSATAHVTRIFGINFEELFNSHSGDFSASVVGTEISPFGFLYTSDKAIAIHNLLENNPGWDFVVYPQFVVDGHNYIIFSEADVTVTARLGRLKN